MHLNKSLLEQELKSVNRLKLENDKLKETVSRLKSQIADHEKNKSANDELIRLLRATLMERETEISILKLKMTRMQTNLSSSIPLNSASNSSLAKQDPCKAFITAGKSRSEFCRNSYIRSSMMAEAASAQSSTSQLMTNDGDASIWAKVPEDLTPSKRPILLEKSLQLTYGESSYGVYSSPQHSSTPITRDRRYKTLPRSMKSPSQEFPKNDSNHDSKPDEPKEQTPCLVTNLDDSNNTSQSSGNKTSEIAKNTDEKPKNNSVETCNSKALERDNFSSSAGIPCKENRLHDMNQMNERSRIPMESSHYSTVNDTNVIKSVETFSTQSFNDGPPSLPARMPSTPVKISSGFKKILGKFRRTDSLSQSKTDLSNQSDTPNSSPFKRSANRSTLIGPPKDIRAQISPMRQAMNFQTDKPFAEWDTDMLIEWLTMIGLSMYANQCRRWAQCGAHIMDATPAEVDKGLGITNHLHRKKLRLAISELNGDCDKITKAAAKLDYLWVARWLDDIGLPQYKEAFINARVDGRVLNYLTVEDLVSMGIKSILHHSSIRSGIKVLRSINFDLQLLKRRAAADEIERMNCMRQRMNQKSDNSSSLDIKGASYDGATICDETDLPLWTCHRLMEWLRMVDLAEFAPNLRGSGVHGGLIVFEDGFNNDTMCSLLSIPTNRTMLRRHLSTSFNSLIGKDLIQKKSQYKDISSNQPLNPLAEIKTPKKSPLWFSKLKSSKVGQDGMDEYLCPMYPVEPQIIKSPTRKTEIGHREGSTLAKIPESINV